MNDDLAVRFADLLESIATKVRSLTVDRVDRGARIVSLGMVAATLAFVALVMLAIGVFRAVAEALGVTGAYLFFGGLFVVGGALAWTIRRRPPKNDNA